MLPWGAVLADEEVQLSTGPAAAPNYDPGGSACECGDRAVFRTLTPADPRGEPLAAAGHPSGRFDRTASQGTALL